MSMKDETCSICGCKLKPNTGGSSMRKKHGPEKWLWICPACMIWLYPGDADWRDHTCGECGYATARNQKDTSWCRKETWGSFGDGSVLGFVNDDYPACPDLVLREDDEES